MTREEEIKALSLMERVESIVATYEPGEIRNDTTVRELKEACRVAITALSAQQEPVKLDRSRWERLTEKRDGQWVIPLRQDGKHSWALTERRGAASSYLYGDHANRLAAYEDTCLEPKEAQKISNVFRQISEEYNCWFDFAVKCVLEKANEPPTTPLTLEELRGMDGEPVYVTSALGEQPMWYIVDVEENELKNPWDRITLEEWDEGYPYKAYRRKPEEGAKWQP